jgi:hypothetical protein
MEPISMLAAGAATLFATRMVEEAGSQTGKGLSAAAGRVGDRAADRLVHVLHEVAARAEIQAWITTW